MTLLHICFFSLTIILLFLQKSYAQINPACNPSSCGNIRNISYPFRLKDIDPPNCGDPRYELVCENNSTTTSLYLNSIKYHVLEINYDNFTIRVVDPNIKINDTYCSFPHHDSLSQYHNLINDQGPFSLSQVLNRPITLMSCPYSLNNSSLFTEITVNCNFNNKNNFTKNTTRSMHYYVKVGYFGTSYVGEMCTIELVLPSSWVRFNNVHNVSVSGIHEAFLYGFELSWWRIYCGKCKNDEYCYLNRTAGCKIECIKPSNWCHYQIPGGNYHEFKCATHMRWFLDAFGYTFGTILTLRNVTAVVIGIRILIGMPFVFGLLLYKYKRRHLSVFDGIEGFLKSQNNLMPIRYSYSRITKMTRNFQEKLGSGGYGSVYKGKLRSGHDVAIKVLNNPRSNGQDFINEIATIGRIHHVNVVRLVGYCAERSKRALVYDFMPNGSLEKYIFNNQEERTDDPSILNWEKKYEIVVGVARGIEYLHRGCDIQILHFDIKPHNILLDQNFVPKISDFGLAKFYSTEKSIVTLTAARGTIGYVAPELINRSIGGVSYKADVYSFGMLLMEMLGLKRNLVANNEHSSMYFPHWIYERFNKGKDVEIGNVDDDDDHARKITRKITIVALWCVQMNPDDRPSMSKVVEMLEVDEDDEQLLQVPPQPSSQTPPQMIQMVQDQTWGTTIHDDSNDSIALMHEHASNDY